MQLQTTGHIILYVGVDSHSVAGLKVSLETCKSYVYSVIHENDIYIVYVLDV